jgi:quercetin dioxygenase-like cupin family protein
MRKLSRMGAVGSLVAGLSLTGVAYGTPAGPGVTGRVITRTTIGGNDYILREVTIPTGQTTGWHFHNGTLYATVTKGTLSHFDSTCMEDGLYPEGSVLTEPSGAGHVHIGENLGATDVVLEVLCVLPHGAPFSRDAPNPGCDFE